MWVCMKMGICRPPNCNFMQFLDRNNYDKTANVRCRFLDKLVWTRFNLEFLEQQKTGIESIVKLSQNHYCHWIALETKTTGNFIGNKRSKKK